MNHLVDSGLYFPCQALLNQPRNYVIEERPAHVEAAVDQHSGAFSFCCAAILAPYSLSVESRLRLTGPAAPCLSSRTRCSSDQRTAGLLNVQPSELLDAYLELLAYPSMDVISTEAHTRECHGGQAENVGAWKSCHSSSNTHRHSGFRGAIG